MKKILAIAPYSYLPYFSGGQKYIAGFYEHLAKKSDLTVISTRNNDEGLATGYRLLRWLKPGFSRYIDTSLISKIAEEAKTGGYDAVIWEHPYYAWLAYRVRGKTGVPAIIHTHNIEYQRFRSMNKWWWPILRSYEKKALRKADRVLFITPEDREYAVNEWGLDPLKCIDLPFGVDISMHPYDKAEQKELIAAKLDIEPSQSLLLFNGLLNYLPNLNALEAILYKINPLLEKVENFQYKIIVCGKDLPRSLNNLDDYRYHNIIYTGFVDDIVPYFKSADVFLNPVLSGGGIKTKMVEALAYGTTVVATETGAKGIMKNACGEKLVVVKDNDWNKFAEAIIEQSRKINQTPGVFYDYYNWDKIISNLLDQLP